MVTHAAPVLVVIGPSGSGKSSAVRVLSDRGLLRVHPTWTTRPRRPDEAGGSVEHRFVTESEFDRLEAGEAFLATVALFGLPHRYGLPSIRRSTDGRVDAVMLRAPLVEPFRRVIPDVHVIQIEDAPERAAARLRARGGSELDLEARLQDNQREILAGRTLADRVIRNDGTLDDLVRRFAAEVHTLRYRRWRAEPARAPRRRSDRVLDTAGAVLAAVLALAGLAVVGCMVLVTVAMNNWASNK